MWYLILYGTFSERDRSKLVNEASMVLVYIFVYGYLSVDVYIL